LQGSAGVGGGRYHALLRSLAGTVQARLAVTTAVGEFWKHSPQHIIITLEKLMTYRIVDAHSIVQWIFSHQVLPYFKQYVPSSDPTLFLSVRRSPDLLLQERQAN
jgi:hypothetical protein